MKRTVIAALASLACAAGLGLAGAGAAAASPRLNVPDTINPTVVFTGPSDPGGMNPSPPGEQCIPPLATAGNPDCTLSMAGWAANSFADLFTQVDGTFSLNAEAEGIGVSQVSGVAGYTGTTHIDGAIGIQLCNESDGDAAQLGAVYVGDVGGTPSFAVGFLTGTLTGLTINPCWGGGVFQTASANTTFTHIGLVPAGTLIEAQIAEDGGGVLFTAENLTTGLANYSYWDKAAPWFDPNEAAGGVQTDTTGLSAPAVNDLTDFSDVYAVDANGVQAGFGYWNAIQVDGSQDGMAPALLEPTALVSNSGPQACHKDWYWVWAGKKHHKHPEHRYHVVCSAPSDVSSSFSVDAGTPVS